MTLSAANPFEEYTIVDSDAPLAFPYPWEFADEILVTENGAALEIGTDYTLTGTGAPGGGTVNPVAAVIGSKWRIYRMTRLAQVTTPSDAAVGFALDRLTKIDQDARRDIDRSVKTEGDVPLTALPAPVPGKALIGKADLTGYELSTTSPEVKFASLDGQIASLAAADAAEIVARNNADGDLAADIVAEANARALAVSNEATARIDQDNILMGLILADGGLADPEDLKAFLGVDVIEDNLTAATSDITTLQSEMDAVEAVLPTKLDANLVSAFVLTLLNDPDASAFLTTLGVSTFVKGILDDTDASAVLTTLGFSTYGKTLIDDADASAALTTLGVSAYIKTLLDDANVGAAQTTLGISTFVKTILDDADAAAVRTTIGAAPAELTGTWTPTAVAFSGTITTLGTTGGRWTRVGRLVFVELFVNITTAGTGTSFLKISLPPAQPADLSHTVCLQGKELSVTGDMLGAHNSSDQFVYAMAFDGTTSPIVNGAAVRLSGFYVGT